MSPLGHLKKYFRHTVSLKWNSESPTCFSSNILISANGLTFHLLMETRNQDVICLSLKSFCSSPNMPRAPTHFRLISDSCSFYLLNLSHICQRLPFSSLITLVRASPLSLLDYFNTSDSSTASIFAPYQSVLHTVAIMVILKNESAQHPSTALENR